MGIDVGSSLKDQKTVTPCPLVLVTKTCLPGDGGPQCENGGSSPSMGANSSAGQGPSQDSSCHIWDDQSWVYFQHGERHLLKSM